MVDIIREKERRAAYEDRSVKSIEIQSGTVEGILSAARRVEAPIVHRKTDSCRGPSLSSFSLATETSSMEGNWVNVNALLRFRVDSSLVDPCANFLIPSAPSLDINEDPEYGSASEQA